MSSDVVSKGSKWKHRALGRFNALHVLLFYLCYSKIRKKKNEKMPWKFRPLVRLQSEPRPPPVRILSELVSSQFEVELNWTHLVDIEFSSQVELNSIDSHFAPVRGAAWVQLSQISAVEFTCIKKIQFDYIPDNQSKSCVGWTFEASWSTVKIHH